jgi:glyoxylase-like metal-dependent hydrolase (beta-lactamase superfamily II)
MMEKSMKRLKVPLAAGLIFAMAALAPSSPTLAQFRPGPPTLIAHPLSGGAYWIQGDAANTGFVVGKDGVVVIDTQRSTEAARLQLAQIAAVTPKPVNAVIVTHGDPDHVGGLMAYPAGSTIIAHENTRAQILATARAPDGASPFIPTYRAIAAERLPNRTIGETENVTLDGIAITLLHIAPAHSSGDLVVFLPRQKVVFVGDLLTTGDASFPIIHVGGSSEGWIRTMRAILALKADIFVSGHGGLKTRQELRSLLQQVEERRAAIKALVYQGKTIAEVIAALPETKVSPMFLGFNETTYFELTEGYPDALPPWASLAPADHRRHSAPVH